MVQTAALLAALLWGAFRGIREGMVMIQYSDLMARNPDVNDDSEGVRVHTWFKWYHHIELGEILTLITASILCYHHIGDITDMVWLTGVIILSWAAFEVCDDYARWKKIRAHENFLGIKSIDGNAVYAIHIARFIVGTALVIGGLFL